MAIGSRSVRNGASGGVTVILPPKGETRVEEPAEKTPMERLFDHLGADDRINVHRQIDDGRGGEKYLGLMVVEAGLLENIEEQVAQRFGGGRYRLVGRSKGATVGSAYIHIDEQMWPPKTREQVKAADVGAPAPAAAPAVLDANALARILADHDEKMMLRMQAALAQQQRPSEGDRVMPLLTAMLDNQMALTREAITARRSEAPAAAPAAPASGDPLAQLTKIADVAAKLGWAPPGQGGGSGDNPNRSLGETLLLRVADRGGEVLAKVAEQKFLNPTPAPAAQPASAPPQPTPSAPAASPALPVHVPGEARLLDAATIQRLRDAQRRTATTAPSASDVLPKGNG